MSIYGDDFIDEDDPEFGEVIKTGKKQDRSALIFECEKCNKVSDSVMAHSALDEISHKIIKLGLQKLQFSHQASVGTYIALARSVQTFSLQARSSKIKIDS